MITLVTTQDTFSGVNLHVVLVLELVRESNKNCLTAISCKKQVQRLFQHFRILYRIAYFVRVNFLM